MGTPAPTPAPGYVTYGRPDPQCVLGVNSAFIYGENLAGVLGLNNSTVVGSNLAFVVNPLSVIQALGVPVPPMLANMCGGGAAGNMTVNLGTVAGINVGPQIAATIASKTENYDADMSATGIKLLLGLLTLNTLTWFIAYGAEQDENNRAIIVTTYQVLMDVFLAVLMNALMATKGLQAGTTAAWSTLFVLDTTAYGKLTTRLAKFGFWAEQFVSWCGAGIVPILVPSLSDALEENHFASQTESYQQQQATQSV